MASIDLTDIQGNILRAFNMKAARYSFYHVDDPVEVRKTLMALASRITSARPWPTKDGKAIKPPSTFNLGLNFRGLRALGLPAETLNGFSAAFQAGMQDRANVLGDRGESDIQNWEDVWRSGQVHLWTGVHALTHADLLAHCDTINQIIDGHGGLRHLADQDAQGLGEGKEHFGFTDGIGNPFVQETVQKYRFPPDPGTRTGKLTPNGQWQPLATGEFLLGHPNEGREVAPLPFPPEFSRNGTFMVYRKLYQNVALFRQFLHQHGPNYVGGPDLLAAKIVGRWRDGTPLALSPDQPDESTRKDNRFTYEDDPRGLRCPLGAHIRRANPRASLGFDGRLVNRHRIIRRGMPYGPPLPEGVMDDDKQERGIIFIAMNASIETQFEFVQQQWLNEGNHFGLGDEEDPLLGDHQHHDTFLIPGDVRQSPGHAPHVCHGLRQYVVTRGGDYFFMPSISGLKLLASGEITVR